MRSSVALPDAKLQGEINSGKLALSPRERSVSTIKTSAILGLRFAVLSLLAVAWAIPAAAQSAEDFYRGKTLKIVVPSTPGGDRALYVLAFVPFFGKHIPGNPTVTPVFMPGAGGSNGVNYTFNVAAPDGLTIVTPLTGVVMAQAMGDDSVRYDVSKFHWLGRTSDSTRIFFVSNKVKARTIADFRSQEVIIGAVGRASETYLNPAFMNSVFGTRFKIVLGYQGAGRMNLAVESGETQGAFTTWNNISTQHPSWLRDKKIRLILQIAGKRHSDLPDIPLMSDLAENDADRALVSFMSSPTQMGQAFAAPPGTPPQLVNALRRAFDATMKDPAFIEKMRTANMEFNPATGEEMTEIVARTIGASPEIIRRYKGAVSER
jgi:tripartite-type tricarboxylate transporter receptor subunit TctC